MEVPLRNTLSAVSILLVVGLAPAAGRGQAFQDTERPPALGPCHVPPGEARSRSRNAIHRRLWRVENCVRLNEVQVLGTHNSYHVQPRPEILRVLADVDPAIADELEYTHRPLHEQFELLGIRQIELDVFADPFGGHYQDPLLPRLMQMPHIVPELDAPGFKVLHVQDLDFESTCLSLVSCLETLRAWSDANPGHLPVAVLVELKDDPIPFVDLGWAVPFEIDAGFLDDLDAEIRSVFPQEQLLTPDDVRGGRDSLEEAVLWDGWPTLAEVRGRVLFLMDNGGRERDLYRMGRPSLEGRVLFTTSSPGQPDAAFVKVNDPFAGGGALVPELVRAGYLVRTRADVPTVQARNGDTTRRDVALASGAQFVSTDYPEPSPFGSGYVVELPGGGVARCNPVNAPPACISALLAP